MVLDAYACTGGGTHEWDNYRTCWCVFSNPRRPGGPGGARSSASQSRRTSVQPRPRGGTARAVCGTHPSGPRAIDSPPAVQCHPRPYLPDVFSRFRDTTRFPNIHLGVENTLSATRLMPYTILAFQQVWPSLLSFRPGRPGGAPANVLEALTAMMDRPGAARVGQGGQMRNCGRDPPGEFRDNGV